MKRSRVVDDRFILEWLQRADRDKEALDEGDKFISLWIAFNGWLKMKYGENTGDFQLIEEVITNSQMNTVFEKLNSENVEFKENLDKLDQYEVVDMREESNESKNKKYNGSFGSLMHIIYRIRCNLFHGRKSVDDEIDYALIVLALNILKPLFKEYLKEYEGIC